MAAVNRTISSGDIGICSSEGIELENGFWAGKGANLGRDKKVHLKQNGYLEKTSHDICDKHECSRLFQDSLQWKEKQH